MTEIPCLLLPGTLCDARLFAPLLAVWKSLGNGTPHSVADLHQLTANPLPWWRTQLSGLPPQFDVLGFSLGGILALQLLGIAPARVRRLTLVASNPCAATAMHRERVNDQLALWHKEGPAAVASQMLDQASPNANHEVRQLVQDMACNTPLSAFLAQGEINATRLDGRPRLQSWPGPVLLISGAEDPWCGADKQLMARSARSDALWQELPHCGHYLPLENPQQLGRLTHNFYRTPDAHQGQ